MSNGKKIIKKYEEKHTLNLFKAQKEVKAILMLPEQEIIQFAKGLTKETVKTSKALKGKLDLAQRKMNRALGNAFVKYNTESTRLSDEKMKELLFDVFRKPTADIIIAKEFAEGSEVASRVFKNRSDKGFKLSDKVWNITKQKRFELDQAVKNAVLQGTSAKDLSKEIQKYLRNPAVSFRRVKDENGNLVESGARKNFKTGRGVYKTSEANAMRLARTEINISYRSADHERWKEMPIVKGIIVKLSNRHPVYDICDEVKGTYPKDFKFTGWHPQCMCHAEPILLSQSELSEYEDFLLGIRNDEPQFKNVDSVPEGLTNWLTENKDRVKQWSSKPYWMADNKSILK